MHLLNWLCPVQCFLSDPGIPGVRSMGPSLCHSHTFGSNFTELTLADEDTNSILTDNANRAIQGNVAKIGTNASGAIWWPNLQPMQDAPSGGQILN